MRNLILVGAAAAALAFGAVSANAIPLSKDASPYALTQQSQPSNGVLTVVEGRSAYVTGANDNQSAPTAPHFWEGRSFH
jgi:hypothetical protein